jgi:hypothetical protein
MEQYISKDALLAEMEKEIKRIYAGREYVGIPSNEENIVRGLQKVEDIIDTLEAKEVDLDKEIDKWYNNEASKEFENVLYEDIEKCAKYFFELGLKAQKGEQ